MRNSPSALWSAKFPLPKFIRLSQFFRTRGKPFIASAVAEDSASPNIALRSNI
jgi:hypothetical protein